MHRFATLTAIATFFLLIAGGMVTSTNSGLAVPDWPLSYGTWFPPMVGGILYEHGHRMIAGVVGLLILALAIWVGWREPRRWVRRLGYAALGAVIGQAILGGMTVLLLLPPQVSIAHACLAQLVFCLVISLSWCTTPHRSPAPAAAVDVRGHSAALGLAAFTQLLLGAVIRHTGGSVIPHVLGAVALSGLAIAFAWRTRREPLLRRDAWRLLGLLAAQVGVGLVVLAGMVVVQMLLGPAALLHLDQALVTMAHQVVGAMVLAHACLLVLMVHRVTRTA